MLSDLSKASHSEGQQYLFDFIKRLSGRAKKVNAVKSSLASVLSLGGNMDKIIDESDCA